MKYKNFDFRNTLLILCFLGFTPALFSQVDSTDYKYFKYENGTISSEGFMVDGKPNFWWKTYYENGILKTEGNRKNFQLDSTWFFYDELGNLRYEINYKNGKKNGEYHNFKNGILVESENYVDDIKNGIHAKFFETGELKKEIPYKEGKRDGIGHDYEIGGRIIAILTYKDDYLKKVEKINRLDKLDRKQGVWKEFYPNGKVKWEGVFVDGEKYGMFKNYDEDGKITQVENYRNGVLDTDSDESITLEIKNKYFDNGKVKSSGSYKGDKKHGTHREYDQNGNIIKSFIYEDGVKVAEGIVDSEGNFTGPWKLYYLDGSIRAEGSYEEGKRVDSWIFYHSNEKIAQKGKYWRGKPDGNWQWYYDNGSLRRDENYRRGLEEGESEEYDEAGNVIGKGEYLEGYKEGNWYIHSGDHTEKGNYIDGEKDGDWIHLYDNGKPSFKGTYQRGLPVDKHRYYYNTGVVKQEGKYASGVKQGVWKTYNMDGEVILSIEYQSGIEIKLQGAKIKPTYQELESE